MFIIYLDFHIGLARLRACSAGRMKARLDVSIVLCEGKQAEIS
jgi:hypothetical protein